MVFNRIRAVPCRGGRNKWRVDGIDAVGRRERWPVWKAGVAMPNNFDKAAWRHLAKPEITAREISGMRR